MRDIILVKSHTSAQGVKMHLLPNMVSISTCKELIRLSALEVENLVGTMVANRNDLKL